MEINKIEKALQIRYIKLHFTLKILEDTTLPKNKVAALRGGMGQMLLKMHCVRNQQCDNCDFEEECIVRRMMYSKLLHKPEYMNQGDSLGYVFECDNLEEYFEEGDSLRFNLLLFGKNIVYFYEYLQAFTYLGMEGIGKNKSKFVVTSVHNTTNKILFEGSNVYMENYHIQTVLEYVKYRLNMRKDENKLIFPVPLTIKYHGEFIDEFKIDAIVAAIIRRIHMLDCFENINNDPISLSGTLPEYISVDARKTYVERYSSTHDSKIRLYGIRGSMYIGEMDKELKMLLLAGELIHIGKNTSFGFGKYTLIDKKG